MKQTLYIFLSILLFASCQKDNESSFSVSGEIEGVRIGKILLQKVEDSALITLDSATFDGNSDYYLSTTIDEPQPLFLHLDLKDGAPYNDRVLFFAEDSSMTINSTVTDFEKNVKVTGSRNHELLQNFKDNKKRLDETYTSLFTRSMELERDGLMTAEASDSIMTAYDKYVRKKVLYAINYAHLYKDMEVAPYILLENASEANPILLDSAFQQMPKKIQTSRYGKQLSEFLSKVKE